ncbi:TPR-like protein [Saccharata proteae CBS 121410]|uniref:TPR-like protein n=1 Tax=Saccharata proteae CBS 121410 TaxID=1314787 RepID=A0A6A5YCH5_9PEZI|nr:TPR-like protein [Saccharata proteae CBS 121410]
MSDAFLAYYRSTLPEELAGALGEQLKDLEDGNFESLLKTDLAQTILGHNDGDSQEIELKNHTSWTDLTNSRIETLFGSQSQDSGDLKENSTVFRQHSLFILGLASLYAFLQSNVTGPPLPFSSAKIVFPENVAADPKALSTLRQRLIGSLGSDGEAAYKLTPNVELICLADTIMKSPMVKNSIEASRWAKMRVDFVHQRLLSEIAPSLQVSIYSDIEALDKTVLTESVPSEARVFYILERATIHTHHSLDKKARADLELITQERNFQFALTGLLGKRTKWQEKDVSQLVVLARSADMPAQESSAEEDKVEAQESSKDSETAPSQPKNLDLNDDTLLESISFSERPKMTTDMVDEASLPPSLASLDPSDQPKLNPLDSITLLSLASSINNTSPEHGLTREETLPYATRVLDGGSSNWQVYTQALLVRSRIEGYRSRTMERGLLQLQALVDQVIAETTSENSVPVESAAETTATTFLPRAKEAESAPVSERLRYVFPLCAPSRWELEAELAARWVSLGGLRSALEIYERLEMWAEAALCWAATEREDRAKKIVRRQLFHATDGNDDAADEDEKWEGKPRDPPPGDAPRLYCILGDVDHDIAMYEKAWEVSNNRYARAQRSLGRHYLRENDYLKAADAYSKSLKVNQLNQQSWFALGCCLLELLEWERAVEAFSRSVQLDDTDAEAWSNLAVALLRLEPKETDDDAAESSRAPADDEEGAYPISTSRRDPQQHVRDALKALKRAATLKYDNYRIWDNYLTVAASTVPPSYNDVVAAQRRIIELRGTTDGEKCVDETILEFLVRHIITTEPEYDPAKPGLTRMVVKMVDEAVVPLITASRKLWSIWNVVVDATVELVDAYESLGQMERTEGLAAGEPVAKDWRFKARTAVKGITSRGRDSWEGTEGWERLKECLAGLKG